MHIPAATTSISFSSYYMSEALFSTVAAAVALFVATNVDDLFVLVGFFSDRRAKALDVVAGQVLGMAALVGASLIAARLSLLLPMPVVGLLGLIPIALGVKDLVGRSADDANEESTAGALSVNSNWRQVLAVALVTVANGGDNIGVYTPVFAVRGAIEVLIIVVVFAIMTLFWCGASHWLVNHQSVGAHVRKLGNHLLPYALIAIGVWILYEADSAALLRLFRDL